MTVASSMRKEREIGGLQNHPKNVGYDSNSEQTDLVSMWLVAAVGMWLVKICKWLVSGSILFCNDSRQTAWHEL